MTGPPDPSQPDRRREEIRSEIEQYLSDPLQLPQGYLTWLSTFVTLNALTTPPASAASATAPTP